jgi:hypothetical protein
MLFHLLFHCLYSSFVCRAVALESLGGFLVASFGFSFQVLAIDDERRLALFEKLVALSSLRFQDGRALLPFSFFLTLKFYGLLLAFGLRPCRDGLFWQPLPDRPHLAVAP